MKLTDMIPADLRKRVYVVVVEGFLLALPALIAGVVALLVAGMKRLASILSPSKRNSGASSKTPKLRSDTQDAQRSTTGPFDSMPGSRTSRKRRRHRR